MVDYPDADPLRWKIPVSLLEPAGEGTEQRLLLEDQPAMVPLGAPEGLIKVNAHDTGYYRVWYEPALFERLRSHIFALAAGDRLNLLDDEWALVEAGRANAADFFSLAEALKPDRTRALWERIVSILTWIDGLEQGSPGEAPFRGYARSLLLPQLQRLGWTPRKGESESDGLLRSSIIWGLGRLGDTGVITQARERFRESLKAPATLGPDLRPAVLRLAGRYADQQTYDQLHALARKAAGSEERQLGYDALAQAIAPDLARQTLALSLSEEGYPQEAADLVVKVANSAGQTELAWDFARHNATQLLSRVAPFTRGSYLPSIMTAFSDATRAAELEAFAKDNPSAASGIRTREAAEQIRFKAALKARELPVIAAWVAGRRPAGP